MSIGRVLLYLANEADSMKWAKDTRAQLRGMQRDVQSLSDHAAYLSNKITFLLDAMLGVVNLEQNNIIKLFSVVAVVFMPPTLIASIYGMNFENMPELKWQYGYYLALAVDAAGGDRSHPLFQMEKMVLILTTRFVAEGVETDDQLAFLSRESCNEVQGYLVGRPLLIENYDNVIGRGEATAVECAEAAGVGRTKPDRKPRIRLVS